MDAVFGNVADLFDNLVPDPDQPDGVPEWMVATLTDGPIHSGVWTCDVGAWDETDYEVDEVMLIVGGHLRITTADGSVHDLKRGDIFFLPKGWAGRWDVIEKMKKVYFVVE